MASKKFQLPTMPQSGIKKCATDGCLNIQTKKFEWCYSCRKDYHNREHCKTWCGACMKKTSECDACHACVYCCRY